MQADFKNMVKEIFGYERVRDIPEEELMHLTRTYGYSPLLQFLYSRYLKEKNDRHYPGSVARTALYFSNPHWLHHQLQKNHLDWIEDSEAERPSALISVEQPGQKLSEEVLSPLLPEVELADADLRNEMVEDSVKEETVDEISSASEAELAIAEEIEELSTDAEAAIIPEEIPEETAIKSENIYANSLLDDVEVADEVDIEDKETNGPGETANDYLNGAYVEPQEEEPVKTEEPVAEQDNVLTETELIYPEFDTVEEAAPLLDADTGFYDQTEESSVEAALPPSITESQVDSERNNEPQPEIGNNENEGDADDTDAGETEHDQPTPGFRPISLPVTNDNETKLSFEPLYVVDYFASQGVKLSTEEESRDLLTSKLKSFTEWLKSMKRIHPEKLSHELDEKTELTIKTVAEHSNEKGEILTETMAEIFMKQGLVEKSMEVYEKLSLLYPSKSDYFAAKISALKAIGT